MAGRKKQRQGKKHYLASLKQFFLDPGNTIRQGINNKKCYLLIVISGVYLLLGILLNSYSSFPLFSVFCICFYFIGIISVIAINYFTKKINKIKVDLSTAYKAKEYAVAMHDKFFGDSPVYVIGPLAVIILFGFGCLDMFKAISVTPALFWMIGQFTVVVYLSIIGYIQYVSLALFIRELAHSDKPYKNLPKSLTEYMPAQIEWVVDLTKLSHVYRTAFFTLGSAYITGFSVFCWHPAMQADITSPFFFILWSVILLAIVSLFPIVSIAEYNWIRTLIKKLKCCLINDLEREERLIEKAKSTEYISPHANRLLQVLCTAQIQSSSDYPIKSLITASYAVVLSLLNFVATIMTILQGITLYQDVFPHIF